MPKTCSTCQFNDNGYCHKFDDDMEGETISCSGYIEMSKGAGRKFMRDAKAEARKYKRFKWYGLIATIRIKLAVLFYKIGDRFNP